jgi:hypothetical protein
MEESRQQLVRAMARGYTLYLRMTNCAADVKKSYQAEDTLPLQVWDREAVARAIGGDSASPLVAVVTEDDCEEFDWYSRQEVVVHEDFRVVVCSHFELADYKDFLERALPLEKMQAISVTGSD